MPNPASPSVFDITALMGDLAQSDRNRDSGWITWPRPQVPSASVLLRPVQAPHGPLVTTPDANSTHRSGVRCRDALRRGRPHRVNPTDEGRRASPTPLRAIRSGVFRHDVFRGVGSGAEISRLRRGSAALKSH